MKPEYLDFELEIGLGQGREYPVAVLRSPAGEARATMRFPFDELQLESRLKDLQIALRDSWGRRRLALTKEQTAVQDFGRMLFDALMTGDVRSMYDVSQKEASDKGLRIKLRIADPVLAALPWEFLYDSRRAEYICLSVHTPIVRYLELPQPPKALAVAPPLRILGMIASPTDLPTLDIQRERERVEQALAGLVAEGLAELVWLPGQTWRHLQRALRQEPWHVFHFVGHGAFDALADEGLVMVCDDRGNARSLRASELGRFLRDNRTLRLVVLNACEGARGSDHDIFSSTASILVQRGLPAVLAMQYEISDRAAIELARAFYESLADGLPVDAAVAEARKSVSVAVNNTVEWGTPVLYMRAPDGEIFDIGAIEQRPTRHPAVAPVTPKPTAPSLATPARLPAVPDSVSTQQATITWLHLSDLHFKDESAYRIDQREKALHSDLKWMRETKHLDPDFMVFTGDLAFSGQKEQYAWVERFLDRIRATLELDDKSRVFMVPGNHDIDRSQVDLITARGALALLDSEEDVASFLAPLSNRKLVFAKFGPFMEFVNRYAEDEFLLDSSHYYWTKRIFIGDQAVGLLGLNSAWMSGFKQDAQGEVSDEGALLVGERQVWEAIQDNKKDGRSNLRIALLHHPIDVLNDAFDKPQVRNLLAKHCDFVLHGHLHYPNVINVSSLEGQTVVIPAGACYDRYRRRSGYNFVQLNMQERTGTVFLRRYSTERNEWIPDLDATGERRNGEAAIEF